MSYKSGAARAQGASKLVFAHPAEARWWNAPALDFHLLRAGKPTPNPETKKNTAFTRTFSKSSRELLLLPCDTSQEINANCSEKLVQMNFFISGGFSSSHLWGGGGNSGWKIWQHLAGDLLACAKKAQNDAIEWGTLRGIFREQRCGLKTHVSCQLLSAKVLLSGLQSHRKGICMYVQE